MAFINEYIQDASLQELCRLKQLVETEINKRHSLDQALNVLNNFILDLEVFIRVTPDINSEKVQEFLKDLLAWSSFRRDMEVK